jgi:hypothetical protein
MAEARGTANTRGRGLLQERWWPIGPKLILDRWQRQSRKLWIQHRKFLGTPASTWKGYEIAPFHNLNKSESAKLVKKLGRGGKNQKQMLHQNTWHQLDVKSQPEGQENKATFRKWGWILDFWVL